MHAKTDTSAFFLGFPFLRLNIKWSSINGPLLLIDQNKSHSVAANSVLPSPNLLSTIFIITPLFFLSGQLAKSNFRFVLYVHATESQQIQLGVDNLISFQVYAYNYM